nr:BolA-like protein 3 [Halisarca dujardinii]
MAARIGRQCAMSLRRLHRIACLFQTTDGEKRIYELLTSSLLPTKLSVKDISGGCGSMYEIDVASAKFQGRRLVQQHQLVNNALKEEFKDLHGLIIRTTVPDSDDL